MGVNQIKTRDRVPAHLLSLSVNSLSIPSFFHPIWAFSASIEHQVCCSLSLIARLSFRRSFALWLAVRKAWIMSASMGTDRSSCAVGLFISQNLFKCASLSSQRRAGWNECVRREEKRGKKSERQCCICGNLPRVTMWAGLKWLEVNALQAKLTGWRAERDR